MAKVEFGISLRRFDEIPQEAREAEAQGYEFLSAGEHVFFHGPTTNGLVALAVAAGATERIKLMTSITLIPLYPAALLAKQIASLDVASGGRFALGVGVGGEFAKEFQACGVPIAERGARTNEALAVMKRLWNEDDVTFEGRFNTLDGVTLSPKPVQRPHPPIWVSGRSRAAMERTARYGSGWLPYMYTPEKLAGSLETIRSFDVERAAPVLPGLFLFFAVHEERDRAIEMAVDRLSVQYNQDFSSLVGKYALAGTPEECVKRLREYVDAGARTVILASVCPADYMQENQRLLAESVLPAFRS